MKGINFQRPECRLVSGDHILKSSIRPKSRLTPFLMSAYQPSTTHPNFHPLKFHEKHHFREIQPLQIHEKYHFR